MAGIDVKGVSEAKKALAALKGQLPFATSLALNKLGQESIAKQKEEMRRKFDRPTPYALNSLFFLRATKNNLQVRTRIKSPKLGEPGQDDKRYIGVQIYGGSRQDKASERRLKTRGLLPDGYQMVPGGGLKRNRYGNVPGGRVAAILRALLGIQRVDRGKRGTGVNTGSITVAAGTFVVGEVGGTRGVWKVQKNKWLPIFIFVRDPRYDPNLDYFGVTDEVFKRRWSALFGDAIDRAIATAR